MIKFLLLLASFATLPDELSHSSYRIRARAWVKLEQVPTYHLDILRGNDPELNNRLDSEFRRRFLANPRPILNTLAKRILDTLKEYPQWIDSDKYIFQEHSMARILAREIEREAHARSLFLHGTANWRGYLEDIEEHGYSTKSSFPFYSYGEEPLYLKDLLQLLHKDNISK